MNTIRVLANDSRIDARSLLGIYLNDHRGGAAGGLALARRSQANNEGSPLGDELRAIVRDLEQDAATLTAIIDRLSIVENPFKRLLARAGELVGRFKPNGRTTTHSPLSRLLELEMLLAGIDAKRSLWRSLNAASSDALSDFDFDELEEGASNQRTRLIPFHAQSAREAFVGRGLRHATAVVGRGNF